MADDETVDDPNPADGRVGDAGDERASAEPALDESARDEAPREQTVADLIGRCLRANGVTRVFGSSSSGIVGLPGLKHLRVDEPVLAALLGDAQGRVTGGTHPGAALLPDRRLRVGSQPGLRLEAQPITDPQLIPEALAAVALSGGFSGIEVVLDVDLEAPAPEGVEPVVFGPSGRLVTLSPTLADLSIIVLAGPGVVRAGKVDALRTFAEATGLRVATTVGSVGALTWNDPRHAGVVGVQDDDFALAGFDDAQIVITVGVDPIEAAPERWGHAQVLDIEPAQLEALAYSWPTPEHAPGLTRLRRAIDDVIEPLADQRSVPLTPARAVADLLMARPRDGVVVADAGPAALWLARAGRISDPATLVLPTFAVHGFAVAAAIAAALDHRRTLAVTTSPLDSVTEALLELAGIVGSAFTVVEWGADVTWSEATAHKVALRTALDTLGVSHVPVPVDLPLTRALVEVAGPISAWPPAFST